MIADALHFMGAEVSYFARSVKPDREHYPTVSVIPDAGNRDSPLPGTGNVHVGAFLRVKAAAHADVFYGMIADALHFMGAEVSYFARSVKPDREASGICYKPLTDLCIPVCTGSAIRLWLLCFQISSDIVQHLPAEKPGRREDSL